MKFVDFGDLVEVTFNDERVELISKEEAYKLGYKERQNIEISYQGNVYNSGQFSKLTDIDESTIYYYYKRGLYTGEEMLQAYNHFKSTHKTRQISYQGNIFTDKQFSELTGMGIVAVRKNYDNGLHTGEEILYAYNKHIKKNEAFQISYQNNVYSAKQFSKITGINIATIKNFYRKGLTGEQIIEAHAKRKTRTNDLLIPYQNNLYNATRFSKLTGMNTQTVIDYHDKGLLTGEEMIQAYTEYKSTHIKVKILYKGNTYNSTQFAKLTGISPTTIRNYYIKGLHTGEEILLSYAKNKRYSNKGVS